MWIVPVSVCSGACGRNADTACYVNSGRWHSRIATACFIAALDVRISTVVLTTMSCNNYSAPISGAEYCDERVCLSLRVCLSASISSELHVRSSSNLLRMLHIAVARSSIICGVVWYGMVNVDLYSAIITKVSNALNTLVSGEKPGFQALSKGLVVLLCAEVVRQGVPDHGAVHSECSASNSG